VVVQKRWMLRRQSRSRCNPDRRSAESRVMRWGLVHAWAVPTATPEPLMIKRGSSRCEHKQVFRDALASKRASYPKTGYSSGRAAEQAKQAGNKKPPPQPFYVNPARTACEPFAGLLGASRTAEQAEEGGRVVLQKMINARRRKFANEVELNDCSTRHSRRVRDMVGAPAPASGDKAGGRWHRRSAVSPPSRAGDRR